MEFWLRRAMACLVILAAGVTPAVASDYPSHPIRLVVPFPPGGPSDLLARTVAQKLQDGLKQPVIVDNRPGGSAIIGSEVVAKAAPDGYTLLMTSTGHSVNATLFRKLPYDTVRDFTPVAALAATPLIVVVGPAIHVDSFRDLITYIRRNPGKVAYGSGGSGTLTHLAPELFKSQTGLDMIHIPYKGVGPMLTDLIGGQVALAFDTLVTSLPHVRAGKLHALAVTSERRTPLFPELPTVSESDPLLKGFDAVGWFGILAPAKTPPDVVGLLNRELIRVLALPEVQERLRSLGAQSLGGSPADFARLIQTEIAKWGAVVRASGAQVD